jgi:hypothetical protein
MTPSEAIFSSCLRPEGAFLRRRTPTRAKIGSLQPSGTAFAFLGGMETLVNLGSSALTIFGSAFTLGTILLVGFVRVCSLSGLVSTEEMQGTLREFLKNFS